MSEKYPPGNPAEEYEPDLLTLEDEAGQEHVFEVIDAADIDGERYLAVAPYVSDPQERLSAEATLLFMRVVREEEEEYLDIVEDEEELSSVLEVFFNRLSEIYDIDIEDLEQGPKD
ncbi:DUF1292 domain-containing protein [Ruminococcaceae bacterium OttesenSCG-928-I18]|nr:DUF1292 domain-containing protein [Ruminococcaceae bacterium OttesenSCG-928-I18]